MYNISIDTGGTFTDCICDYNGVITKLKLLSKSVLRSEIVEIISENSVKIKDSWGLKTDFFEGFFFSRVGLNQEKIKVKSFDPFRKILTFQSPILFNNFEPEYSFELFTGEEVPIFAIRLLTETSIFQSFTEISLKLGSTKGTNALLENKGSKVLFIVTQGFKDLLYIGNQSRPDIFAINVRKQAPLHHSVLEVYEQIDSDGRIIVPINLEKIHKTIISLRDSFDCIAICFKNSYKNAIHEVELATYLKQFYKYISYSTDLSSHIKFLHRAETTVVNAYLSPTINDYIFNIREKFNKDFLVMTSAGNLVSSSNFHPKDSLLSGPAGGIVGAAKVAESSGYLQIISFDMGGTSTDVARYDGEFDYKSEISIGSSNIFSPALAIETVAAGGGSICYFDGYKLKVGPASAGSDPGPACYGAGGPLTITDVNLLLGRVDTSFFSIPIEYSMAEKRIDEVICQIHETSNYKITKEELLESFLEIANEIMADTIRKISVSKGFDASDYSLVAFGGAGGMHACAIANLLNINTIIVPDDAGLLSAAGISQSKIQKIVEWPILFEFSDQNITSIQNILNHLEVEAFKQLAEISGKSDGNFIKNRIIKLRIKGQDSSLDIPFLGKVEYERELYSFNILYNKIYGHWHEHLAIEVASIVVHVSENDEIDIMESPKFDSKITSNQDFYEPEPDWRKKAYFNGEWREINVYSREKLKPGAKISGFSLLIDPFATTVIEEGWSLIIDNNLTAILVKEKASLLKSNMTEHAELELFTNRFMALAEQMGVMLQRTSLSVNVKVRLDFSCALMDSNARLIANAPHIPVHLGSLGVCLRTVLEKIKIEKDDVVITNHPKYGGSHLPDVTIISSVFTPENELVGYVACRCHHAEIGGIRPASMPPNAQNLEEEGVVIEPTYLVKNGVIQFEDIKNRLLGAKYPTRSVLENMADISAALAANNSGKEALLKMVEKFGREKVSNFMRLLLLNSTQIMNLKFKEYGSKQLEAEEFLDDGSVLKVRINICDSGSCVFDFSGSSAVHKGNLNANEAIVNSVIVYILRLLIQAPVPLNEGLMENVRVVIPANSILNPVFPDNPAHAPAVVGGNVETSQRLTDTILKAFGLMACSQGTMNNTLFGNDNFGYYETVCGGTGAGKDFHGASGVHSHMTNTRITDPEIMELRYPVRLKRFEIRENSGGKGKYNGGDGIIREIEFLAPVKLSVLSQHRNNAPYGMNGGSDGAKGNQYIIKKNGEKLTLQGVDAADLSEGDRLIMLTPGGGAWN